MSIDTWKAEFYPTEAVDCTPEDSLKHSLQKWTGFNKKNLAKHKCKLSNIDFDIKIIDSDFNFFYIDSSSCALCENFFDDDNECHECPLAIARGEFGYGSVKCDSHREDECIPPWQDFTKNQSHKKMLYWLRRATKEQS